MRQVLQHKGGERKRLQKCLKVLGSILLALSVAMGFSGVNVRPAHATGPGTVLADCIPSVSGNGRAMATDGSFVYYTLSGGATIYKIAPPTSGTIGSPSSCTVVGSCTSPVAPIAALSFDQKDGNAWAGAYDGSGRIWKLNPNTCATVVFPFSTLLLAAGEIFSGFIDGLALDPKDSTLWFGSDEAMNIHHITTFGAQIGVCDTPPPPMATTGNGLRAGITADKDNLFISLYTSLDGAPRSIATVNKANGGVCTKITEFSTNGLGTEGLALGQLGTHTIFSDAFGFVNHITKWSLT